MLTERLKARCRSAVPLGAASLSGYALEFSKRSAIDHSGKATLVRADGETVHGVMFEIPLSERDQLDKAEGLGGGYERRDDIEIMCSRTGQTVIASSYIGLPSAIERTLMPFDWYHALVMAGARQHKLPSSHTDILARAVFTADTNLARGTRREALRALDAAGYEHGLPYPA